MDGLFHGKPYVLMDDLGEKTTPVFGNSHLMDVETTPETVGNSGGTRVG